MNNQPAPHPHWSKPKNVIGRGLAALIGQDAVAALSNAADASTTEVGQFPPIPDEARTKVANQIASEVPTKAVDNDSFDRHNAEQWVCRLNRQLGEASDLFRKSAEKLVAVGLALLDCKKTVGHGSFSKMFHPGRLRISQDTAEMLIRIVKNGVLTNSDSSRKLPPAINTLHRLAKIKQTSALQQAFDDDRISPLMTTKEARSLAAELDPPKKTGPEENLDYFRKKLGGYLTRQLNSIDDDELKLDLIAELVTTLSGMAEALEEPVHGRSKAARSCDD
jgi:hypothetical protein